MTIFLSLDSFYYELWLSPWYGTDVIATTTANRGLLEIPRK